MKSTIGRETSLKSTLIVPNSMVTHQLSLNSTHQCFMAAFVMNAADLQPANACHRLMKYADDTYLIVPASASYSVEDELIRIEA